MSEAKQMLFSKNLICVCVDENDNADYQGVIWHQYDDEPVSFSGIYDMLVKVDELFDTWDFPQRSLERRSFNTSVTDIGLDNPKEPLIDVIRKQSGIRNIQDKKGKLATFILQVSFRQNATWQGDVLNVSSNEKESFISALELVRIMDKALADI
jgi:hypothetical protein